MALRHFIDTLTDLLVGLGRLGSSSSGRYFCQIFFHFYYLNYLIDITCIIYTSVLHADIEKFNKSANNENTCAINILMFPIPCCGKSHHILHHDDVVKWKHFPRYWPFVRGMHRSPLDSLTKARDAQL